MGLGVRRFLGVDGEAAVRVDRADLVVAVGGGGQLPVIGGSARGRGSTGHAQGSPVGQRNRVLAGGEGVARGVDVGGGLTQGLDARLESLNVAVGLGGLGVPEHLGAVAQAFGDPGFGLVVGDLAVATLPDGDLAAADGGVGHLVAIVLVERVHRPRSVDAFQALHLHDVGGRLITVVVQGGGGVDDGVTRVNEVLDGQAAVGVLLAGLALAPVFDDDVLVDRDARDVGDAVVPHAQRAAAGLDVRVDLVDEVIERGVEGHRLVAVVVADLLEVLLELAGALLEEELVGAHVPFGGAEGVHVLVDEVEVELLGGGVDEVEVVGALLAGVVGDLVLREVAKDGAGVAGSIQERDDANTDLATVLDDGLDLILRVVREGGGGGVLVGLDAQLEGQVVHLQVGHAVDLSGDPVRGDVGAARAQGGATVGEARDVGDASGGHGALACAHSLFDGAGAPQEAGASGGHDLGAVCADGQLVALITEVGAGRVDREGDGVGGGGRAGALGDAGDTCVGESAAQQGTDAGSVGGVGADDLQSAGRGPGARGRGPALEGGDRHGDVRGRLRVQVGGQGDEDRGDEGAHGREDERDFRSGAREPRRPSMAWR